MIKELLTYFAFPGVSNRDASPYIQRLRRTDAVGEIEYVVLIAPESPTVVFVSHGRLRALDTTGVEQWKSLAGKRGVSVVLHNYPGYGGTAGPATEERLCADALQLVTFVMELKWAAGKRLCLLGNSVGCGPTMWLAAQQQLDADRVVLVSPYTSISALTPFWVLLYLAKYLHVSIPTSWKLWLGSPAHLKWVQGARFDPFPPIALARRLAKGTNVLLVHGEDDTTVLVSHTYELNAVLQTVPAVNTTVCIIPGTEHKDTRLRGDDAIWAFVKGQDAELRSAIDGIVKGGVVKVDNAVGTD
ncbi:Alpha/Beta hydrolase protein [Tricharina praecox]|uniref:Alpha/Beta hydrolase protein n=1 Tax=Tricharina praecox TaxID=43433 RepID=UPI00221FF85E|nr:Alpha/Beta hydrolase protein [Tricharina praecox]KAI5844139.1 Alpha/Beta hydrolase protein [Tricharina praecox]